MSIQVVFVEMLELLGVRITACDNEVSNLILSVHSRE